MKHNLKIALAFFGILGASLTCTQITSTPVQPEEVEPVETAITAESTQYSVFLPGVGREPTPAVDSGGEPTSIAVDPHVEIEASQTTLKVGEFLTVVGRAVGIGRPYYYLNVRDEGIQDALPMVQVTYNNQVTRLEAASLMLELVSAEGSKDEVTFMLHAKEVGVTSITISATGDIQGSTDEGTWSGGGSGTIVITVTE